MIEQDIFSLLVFVMFGYILLTPAAIGFAISHAKEPERTAPEMTMPPSFARQALEGITVNSVMDWTRNYPASTLPVMDFVDKWIVSHQPDYLVVEGGTPVGVVSKRVIGRVFPCRSRRGEGRSAGGMQRSQDGSDRAREAGDTGVHGACLPVMRASAREERWRISFTSRSSLRLFSIHSR